MPVPEYRRIFANEIEEKKHYENIKLQLQIQLYDKFQVINFDTNFYHYIELLFDEILKGYPKFYKMQLAQYLLNK